VRVDDWIHFVRWKGGTLELEVNTRVQHCYTACKEKKGGRQRLIGKGKQGKTGDLFDRYDRESKGLKKRGKELRKRGVLEPFATCQKRRAGSANGMRLKVARQPLKKKI